MKQPATLKQRRLDAGLSQQQLATKANCSIAMVRFLETGFRPEKSEVLERIERVLADSSTSKNGTP